MFYVVEKGWIKISKVEHKSNFNEQQKKTEKEKNEIKKHYSNYF